MAVIFPRESNLSIGNRFYAVIGNGYFVGVSPQVFNHLFWPEKRLLGILSISSGKMVYKKSPLM
jgi:hypothetical protein